MSTNHDKANQFAGEPEGRRFEEIAQNEEREFRWNQRDERTAEEKEEKKEARKAANKRPK